MKNTNITEAIVSAIVAFATNGDNSFADLTADEMRAVDKAIFISLDTNHYYQTLQNMYNDKLQYIEKLKSNRSSLQADLATKQQYIDDFEKMLNTYDFSDIQSLEKFLEENRKEK